MDILIKQMRVRFSGAGQENTGEPSSSSSRGKRIPPQKTVSFKGDFVEKKRTQNWFQRQFSGKMSPDYDSSNDIERAISVAAAAYAINKLEESSIANPENTSEGPEPSLTKQKSRKETTISIQEPGGVSKRFSGGVSMKSSERSDAETKVPITAATNETRKSSTKTDLPKIKPGSPAPKAEPPTIKPRSGVPKPDLPPIIKPATQPTETKRQSPTRPGTEEMKAEKWEKAEMEKINEQYEKSNKTILSWEDNKKRKARRKLDRTESELEGRRKKGLEKFREDMEYIDKIAGGARAKAEENRRNEELKAKVKAKKIRTTGKVPRTCFCF